MKAVRMDLKKCNLSETEKSFKATIKKSRYKMVRSILYLKTFQN